MQSVHDDAFRMFGEVVEGYDFTDLVRTLNVTTPLPNDGVIYVPSDEALETLPVFRQLQERLYGGLPIQLGYCNGTNAALNCLEYHRGSELNVAAEDVVLLVAHRAELDNEFRMNTNRVQAFVVPAGEAVLLYETTMHYAPARADGSFRVAIGLPKGTNLAVPDIVAANDEDRLLSACNKWLIAHADASEAEDGAWVGLTGPNIVLTDNC